MLYAFYLFFILGNDEFMGAQFFGILLFRRGGAENGYFGAHRDSEFYAHMTESP